ncbi:MAG: cAMP-binding protein [Thalassobius sp.]|nr:cAMP-binding protein [Thalassovita sp.]
MIVEEIIKTINEVYAPLSSECQVELMSHVKLLEVKKNTVLVKEGQYSDKLFFIVKGCARAYYLNNGKDVTEWFAFENDFICAIQSFFQLIPSPHYIEVLDDTLLMEMSRESINSLSNNYHEFERLAKIIVTKTMLQLQERIIDMQFKSAKQKYEKINALRPDITQRVPLTHIASYLGITLETLSRIRKPNLI